MQHTIVARCFLWETTPSGLLYEKYGNKFSRFGSWTCTIARYPNCEWNVVRHNITSQSAIFIARNHVRATTSLPVLGHWVGGSGEQAPACPSHRSPLSTPVQECSSAEDQARRRRIYKAPLHRGANKQPSRLNPVHNNTSWDEGQACRLVPNHSVT